MDRRAWWAKIIGSQRVGHNWSDSSCMHRECQDYYKDYVEHMKLNIMLYMSIISQFFKNQHIILKTAAIQTTWEGNGTPLQSSCLENPMDGGAWWATVHGVAKRRTQLSNFTFTFHFDALEKEMATHSSVLAWRIPGTGEPGGCLWGHTESDTTKVT